MALTNLGKSDGQTLSASEINTLLKADGDTGIGTSSPTKHLHISGSDSDEGILIHRSGINSTDKTMLYLRGTPSTDNTTDTLGITFEFTNAAQSVGGASAQIVSGKETDWTSGGNLDGYLSFYTSLNGTSNEVLRINSEGNIGINTDAPESLLEIFNSPDSGGTTVLDMVDINRDSGSNLQSGGGNALTFSLRDYAGDSGVVACRHSVFNTNNSTGDTRPAYTIQIGNNGSVSEKIRLTYDGKLGIGTSNPQQLLHINTSSGGVGIRIQDDATRAFVIENSSNEFKIQDQSIGSYRLTIDSSGNTKPSVDNTYTCGDGSFRWSDIYAASGSVNTSDEREKTDILDLSDSTKFIMSLRPVEFKYNWGKRTHYGFIAQDLKKIIEETGKDFAAFVHSHYEEVDEEGNIIQKDRMGIRYSELIAPLVKAFQEAYYHVNNRLKTLEENINGTTAL